METEEQHVYDVLGLAEAAAEVNEEEVQDVDQEQDFSLPREEREPEQVQEQEPEPESETELELEAETETEPEDEVEVEPEPEPEGFDLDAMRAELERLNAELTARPGASEPAEAGIQEPEVSSEPIQFIENMDELDEMLTSVEGANKLLGKFYARLYKDIMTAAPQAMIGVAASTTETLVENALYLRDNSDLQRSPATLRRYLEEVHTEKPDLSYTDKLAEAGRRTRRLLAIEVQAAEIQGIKPAGGKPPGPPRSRNRHPPREESQDLLDGEAKVVADVLGI